MYGYLFYGLGLGYEFDINLNKFVYPHSGRLLGLRYEREESRPSILVFATYKYVDICIDIDTRSMTVFRIRRLDRAEAVSCRVIRTLRPRGGTRHT